MEYAIIVIKLIGILYAKSVAIHGIMEQLIELLNKTHKIFSIYIITRDLYNRALINDKNSPTS